MGDLEDDEHLDVCQNIEVGLKRQYELHTDLTDSICIFALDNAKIAIRKTTKDVEAALHATGNITNIQPAVMRQHPQVLATLRMSTCPPLAVDRLIGLAGVPTTLVKCMEIGKKLPPRMPAADIDRALAKIATVIETMADPDIFVWLQRKEPATDTEIHRAARACIDKACSIGDLQNCASEILSGRLRITSGGN